MLKTKLGCFLLLAAHALYMVAGSSNGANEVSLAIKDSSYSLSMSRTTGSVTYLGKNENLLTDGGEPLFRIRFRDEDGTPHIYTAADARTCTLVERGKHLTFAYSDFQDRFFQVQVTVRADRKDGLFHFSMKVDTDDQIESQRTRESYGLTTKEASSAMLPNIITLNQSTPARATTACIQGWF